MKNEADFATGSRRSTLKRATPHASQVLLQAEGAGIGTEYGGQLLEQAIILARSERIPIVDPLKEHPTLKQGVPDGHGEAEDQAQTETQQCPQRSSRCVPPPDENDDASNETDQENRQIYREHRNEYLNKVGIVHKTGSM